MIKSISPTLAAIEFPVTLTEIKNFLPDIPKTERVFYDAAVKALEKVLKGEENIHYFGIADSALTKTGFMFITEQKIYFTIHKVGLTGAFAKLDELEYSTIQSVDFDVLTGPNPWGLNQGVLELKLRGGLFGSKSRTIRNIEEHKLQYIVNYLRSRI